mmetsp:Transcript_19600/g.58086  ORF Transcript_19600/g.58086 Transcript_19600/m.58086 type:complete len:244 (+) Transcript_19600:381-1112(+)
MPLRVSNARPTAPVPTNGRRGSGRRVASLPSSSASAFALRWSPSGPGGRKSSTTNRPAARCSTKASRAFEAPVARLTSARMLAEKLLTSGDAASATLAVCSASSTRTAPSGARGRAWLLTSSLGSEYWSQPLSSRGRIRKRHPSGQRRVVISSKPGDGSPSAITQLRCRPVALRRAYSTSQSSCERHGLVAHSTRNEAELVARTVGGRVRLACIASVTSASLERLGLLSPAALTATSLKRCDA